MHWGHNDPHQPSRMADQPLQRHLAFQLTPSLGVWSRAASALRSFLTSRKNRHNFHPNFETHAGAACGCLWILVPAYRFPRTPWGPIPSKFQPKPTSIAPAMPVDLGTCPDSRPKWSFLRRLEQTFGHNVRTFGHYVRIYVSLYMG